MYTGFVTTIKNLRPHPNADRLDLGECFGKSHVREGVVVRIINRPKFCAYKHKNWSFKVLENLVKDEAIVPDMEEAQDA